MLIVLYIVAGTILLAAALLLVWGGRITRAATGIAAIVLAAGAVFWFVREPTCIRELRQFAERVEVSVDPIALQMWATNTLAQHARGDIPVSEIPDYVRRITRQSPAVSVSSAGDDGARSCVWIVYGGGFGHWGLKVGGPDFRVPADTDWSYYIEWKPGIYFWTQTK